MTGDELRARIDNLDLTYVEAAKRLGLSLSGLHHNMRGETPIGRQTEMLLQQLERGCNGVSTQRRKPPRPVQRRRETP